MSDRVIIFDTTLRDGEQSPGASMNTAEKVRLAIQLEKLGVDVIEAGFPAASPGDFEAVAKIAAVIKNAEVAGLARATRQDIDHAWGAIKHAAKPRLHTFIATSDIHMKHKLNMDEGQVVKAAVEAVRYAKSKTVNVEFSAEDGSRSNWDFLCRIFAAVIEAGATTVNLPDTVGYAVPDEFAAMVKYIRKNISNIDQAVFSVHCHNDLGLATANTMSAIKAGARQVEVTMNGIGERAGNTSLEEVVMALYTRSNHFNYRTNIKHEYIFPVSQLTRLISGIMVQPNKAIVGANAFAHEAGIHQDGVLKNPLTYEIMSPATIGLGSNNLVLGKHSGRHAVRDRLAVLGYALSADDIQAVFGKFKELADKKKTVSDEDLAALVVDNLSRGDDKYELDYIHATAGSSVMPIASVCLVIDGERKKGAQYGNGPIDATYNTIMDLSGNNAKLLEFHVGSLSGGTDAQGEVSVKIAKYGIVTTGKAMDSDIINASAKALVDALNRVERIRSNPKYVGTRSDNLGQDLMQNAKVMPIRKTVNE